MQKYSNLLSNGLTLLWSCQFGTDPARVNLLGALGAMIDEVRQLSNALNVRLA